MTHAPWRLPVALGVAASVMVVVLIRVADDCSRIGSDSREVMIGALLLASGAAVTLAVSFPVLRSFRNPALASAVGVAAGAAFGAAFFLYALKTELGYCPS